MGGKLRLSKVQTRVGCSVATDNFCSTANGQMTIYLTKTPLIFQSFFGEICIMWKLFSSSMYTECKLLTQTHTKIDIGYFESVSLMQ